MAGRPDAFMPLYIGDYLADTSHLSTLEHGAYLLLLMHYWRTGKALPIEAEKLARIAKMPRADWDTVTVTVTAFFTVTVMDTVTVLTHKRVEGELEHAKGKYAVRKAASDRANAAKKAAAERLANRKGDRDGDRDGIPIGTQSQSQPQSSKEESELRSDIGPSQAKPDKPKRERKVLSSLPDDCPTETDRSAADRYWRDRGRDDLCARLGDEAQSFRDHHRSRGSRMADWSAAWCTWYGNALKFNRPQGGGNPFPTVKILKVV